MVWQWCDKTHGSMEQNWAQTDPAIHGQYDLNKGAAVIQWGNDILFNK